MGNHSCWMNIGLSALLENIQRHEFGRVKGRSGRSLAEDWKSEYEKSTKYVGIEFYI